MESKTLSGGCHCGQVRFEVFVEQFVALECNCSICQKKGFLHVIVPKNAFRNLTDSAVLTTYRFNTGLAQHCFCASCGIHSFYVPRSHPDGVSVNARCLEDDALSLFTVQPFDGANWEREVSKIR